MVRARIVEESLEVAYKEFRATLPNLFQLTEMPKKPITPPMLRSWFFGDNEARAEHVMAALLSQLAAPLDQANWSRLRKDGDYADGVARHMKAAVAMLYPDANVSCSPRGGTCALVWRPSREQSVEVTLTLAGPHKKVIAEGVVMRRMGVYRRISGVELEFGVERLSYGG